MKNANLYFNDLKNALETRNAAIRRALEDYQTTADRAASRYSESVAAEETEKAALKAQQTIEAADQAAHDEAEKAVEALRGKLAEYITGETDLSLLAKLQAVQMCGVKLTLSEIESMAKKAGDPVTLACLAQVAEKSGFGLTFTTSKMLEDDLKQIKSMFIVPSHYTPDGMFSAGLKCHPNQKYMGIDRGRPDVVALSVRMKPHKDAPSKLDEIASRWSNPRSVEVKQAQII